MPLTGPWKLQLSKGISRVFRGVLGAVPVVDNRCAEVVAESHRSMGISCTPTLTQRAITARGERMISYENMNNLCQKKRHYWHEGKGSTEFTLPEGIFYKGGAHSFLDDFRDPALKTFKTCC